MAQVTNKNPLETILGLLPGEPIARGAVEHRRLADADFAEAWDDPYQAGNDRLEDEAHRRAVDGVAKPVMYRGEVVGEVREYSDALLMFLLRGRRPDRYGTSHARVQVSGSVGLPPAELEAIRRAGSNPGLAAALDLIVEEFARRRQSEDEGGQAPRG